MAEDKSGPKATLFAQAQEAALQPPTELQDLALDVAQAIQELADKICIAEKTDEHILAAARVGATHIDVLRFHGTDLEEKSGMPYLTLVKGPRDPDLRLLLDAFPESTLLDALRHRLAPFKIAHVWHPRTNLNRLVVSWEH